MSEPVLVVLAFRNDGEPEAMPACISSFPLHLAVRKAVWQYLTPEQLEKFGDNLTLYWEAEFNGEAFDLIRPITLREVEQMQSYRCPETTDMDL
jgi:hypothetical protein